VSVKIEVSGNIFFKLFDVVKQKDVLFNVYLADASTVGIVQQLPDDARPNKKRHLA
jgi:hypothetical protein